MIDLNRWSAETLMGWWWDDYYGVYVDDEAEEVHKDWNPLSDLNQAFQVVDKLPEFGYKITISQVRVNSPITYPVKLYDKSGTLTRTWYAKTLAELNEAILKAAKAAVEEK